MRLFVVSFLIALVLLLPTLAEHLDFSFPLQGLIGIPATGLGYMTIFFHELGHAVAWLSFGAPALPSFDFQDGGGMTYAFERSWILQGMIWALMAMGIAWLWKRELKIPAVIAALLTILHVATGLGRGHEILASFMGHGGEILIACFCLLRVLTGTVEGGGVEKYLHLTFALFTFGKNAILSLGLMTSDIARMAYDMQKGGHVSGDFRTIAETLGARIETVALSSLIVMAALVALTLWLGRAYSRP